MLIININLSKDVLVNSLYPLAFYLPPVTTRYAALTMRQAFIEFTFIRNAIAHVVDNALSAP
jgi:hypothetical protein